MIGFLFMEKINATSNFHDDEDDGDQHDEDDGNDGDDDDDDDCHCHHHQHHTRNKKDKPLSGQYVYKRRYASMASMSNFNVILETRKVSHLVASMSISTCIFELSY